MATDLESQVTYPRNNRSLFFPDQDIARVLFSTRLTMFHIIRLFKASLVFAILVTFGFLFTDIFECRYRKNDLGSLVYGCSHGDVKMKDQVAQTSFKWNVANSDMKRLAPRPRVTVRSDQTYKRNANIELSVVDVTGHGERGTGIKAHNNANVPKGSPAKSLEHPSPRQDFSYSRASRADSPGLDADSITRINGSRLINVVKPRRSLTKSRKNHNRRAPGPSVMVNRVELPNSKLSGAVGASGSTSRLIGTSNNSPPDWPLCKDNPHRNTLRDLLASWHLLAAKHKIRYFITSGSLLGYYRNRDIIPYDSDVDVYVDVDSYSTLRSIASPRDFKFKTADSKTRLVVQMDYWGTPMDSRIRTSCDGRTVDRGSVDPCSFQDPMARLIRRGRYVDIFAYFTTNGVVNTTPTPMYYDPTTKKYFKPEDFFPIKPCTFIGTPTYCPRNAETMLKTMYGEHFATPYKICKNGLWVKRGN
ncbi:predicted protein [Nematostella vectensis]|uniref:LicD/FKTN/FKRP nucleotidyltransferase domain-containing protein n=1 Tax=Nematostella vectensis TaxID=45351 RepID=A7SCH0_NEMVE|nr:predicted protein [Nematostella vectensis]|eukprot:XP_001630663.1 predicted protein [Nematostella vectensis]